MNTGDIIKAGITLARMIFGRDPGEGEGVLTVPEALRLPFVCPASQG